MRGKEPAYENEDMRAYTTERPELTSECWLVQFRGLEACVDCELFNTRECGGGLTLIKMVLSEHKGTPPAAWWALGKLQELDPAPTFYEIREMVSACDSRIPYISALQYPIRKYLHEVKLSRIAKRDSSRHPGAPKLDPLYPHEEVSASARRLLAMGWHRPWACECRGITPAGAAYRDEVYQLPDGTLVFYLHQHAIVALKPIGGRVSVTLDSCGWRTYTTKLRMNRWIPGGYLVYQKRYTWYLKTPTGTQEFYDGITFEVPLEELGRALERVRGAKGR